VLSLHIGKGGRIVVHEVVPNGLHVGQRAVSEWVVGAELVPHPPHLVMGREVGRVISVNTPSSINGSGIELLKLVCMTKLHVAGPSKGFDRTENSMKEMVPL
jgi:hypothetical protein